jgi:hypothetical protein
MERLLLFYKSKKSQKSRPEMQYRNYLPAIGIFPYI